MLTPSLSSRSSAKGLMNYVRVVHLNGCLEYFEPPVMVGQVTSNGNKLFSRPFLCTSNLLRPDKAFEASHLYFLLAFSALQADMLSMQANRVQRVPITDPPETSLSERLYVSSLMCSLANSSCPSRSPIRPPKTERDTIAYGATNLDPVKDKSFNRRSELDMQEQHSEMVK
ncbi:hypothetical protein ACJRO7_014896 [Eucalyptus globulus]|uniref:Uncharacterized protein n=1 Tax=Eucalyptus globulus TaxID=34317 RepID=A0ABD3L2G8_EUCGL